MVTLTNALAVLYPDARPLTDYVVSDDGTGPRLTAWRLPGPQPTPEQLAAVTPEQVGAARLARASQAAVTAFLGSLDPSAVAVRVIARRLATWINDEREARGQPRRTEPEIVAALLADAAAGWGAPITAGSV